MLIKDMSEVARVINVSAATSFETLATHINNAETKYIIPLLGSEMYQALTSYHKEGTFFFFDPKFSAVYKEGSTHSESDHYHAYLLWQCQYAIIHLAYFIGFDVLNTYMSDGGFKRSESDKVKPLYKYQEYRLKQYFHETGMNTLDSVLEILEAHLALFPEFADQMAKLKGRIIPDTKTFQQHYNINSSRLTFMRLQQHLKTIEELHLLPELGKENWDYILSEIKKPEPAEKVANILPYLRDPTAYLSVAMLMQESGADLSHRGLVFLNAPQTDEPQPADESRIRELVQRNQMLGQRYIDRLNSYLSRNTDQWEIFNPRGLHNRDNAGKRTFWA